MVGFACACRDRGTAALFVGATFLRLARALFS